MKKKLSVFCSLLLALSMIMPMAVMPVFADDEPAEKYEALDSPAVVYNMNIGWKFTKAKENTMDKNGTPAPSFSLETAAASVKNGEYDFFDANYDDDAWEDVSLPHSVNAEDSFDETGVTDGESGLYRGFMFYRKKITVPESDAGKKLFLEFEAFRQSVYLYVNTQLVGYYEAGIAPVGFDITDYVVSGENTIAVAVDNMGARGINNDFTWAYGTRETVPGKTAGGQSGITYQWNTKEFNEIQGGLNGNVNLYAKNKIYQTLPLYNNLKTTGNYIYADNFDFRENSADVTVEAEVRNESGEDKSVTLQVDVVDSDGNLVDSFTETKNVPAASADDIAAAKAIKSTVPADAYTDEIGDDGKYIAAAEKNAADTTTVAVTKIKATKNIEKLKFWSDVSPNLYTVYTYLKDGNTVIDSQEKVTGFREVTYDKDKGLQINGKTTYLKGYAQRSTNEWAVIGIANDWLEDIDMQLVKESNANYIRWMHVAPKPNEIRSGDKYGVISIAPAGDKEKPTAGRSWDQRMEAMRDTIIYFRNSPSVLFYEAGNNEISAERMQAMTDLRKELDPNGDRRMGCRTIASNEQIAAAEWAGTMLYRHDSGAYGAMQATGNYIPILETEYHRNEAPRRVWDDYSPPYFDYVNKWSGGREATNGLDMWDQTQEDFSRTMFNTTDGYSYYFNNRVGGTGKPYYTGAAMMVWSDSNMHVRNCYSENDRTSGRVDAVRIKKESFYAIQAAQSSTPKIHILGHWNYPKYEAGVEKDNNYWYNLKKDNGSYYAETGEKAQRDPTKKTVYVIGSEGVSKVELFVNGVSKGVDSSPDDNYIYAFDNVDVTESGTVSAKAYDEMGDLVAEHEINTVGEAATVRLTPVVGPDDQLLADGSDIAYFDVEVVDAEGNVCPLDERKITFTLNGPGVFLGGYNSGVGDRIVNRKDYVFAECGVNRVFVQSTRTAGDITLTAQGEDMQPVSVTITSKAVELTGGLTTDAQRSFAQGAVPAPPAQQSAPVLKPLGKVFTAIWDGEDKNVAAVKEAGKEYYDIYVNDSKVTVTDRAYKESGDLIYGEINPVLAALKVANADFEYTYHTTGELPSEIAAVGELPYLKLIIDGKTMYIANLGTDMWDGNALSTMMAMPAANSDGSALLCDIASVVSRIPGVTVSRDEEDEDDLKLLISYEDIDTTSADDIEPFEASNYTASLAYSDGKVTVTSASKLENANLIFAGYTSAGALSKVKIQKVSVDANAASQPIEIDADVKACSSVKAMLWDADMSKALPIAEVIPCGASDPSVTPAPVYKVDEIYQPFDGETKAFDCNTLPTFDSKGGTIKLSDDTSPDGTKYIQNVDYAGKEGFCFQSYGLGANSKETLMWEADVRFDANGSGITPMNEGDKDLASCVRRYDEDGVNWLTLRTGSGSGSSNFAKVVEIDPTAWYHIALVGRYSAPDARTDMFVYKYNGSEKVFVGRYDKVSQRNMSANSKAGASHWNVMPGTSVDNLKITKLGADTLYVDSDVSEIDSGNEMQMSYSATRQGEYITNPSVKWEIYNADNTAKLEDENITISQTGLLNVGIEAESQKINVRVTETDSEGEIKAGGLVGVKELTIKSVDISNLSFDTLKLSAEKTYVKTGEPLTISVKATKKGQEVSIEDSDLIWYATDSTGLQKLGDNPKWIKIANGVVTVDEKAVSQDIMVYAADPDDKVRDRIAVHIKSSDALEGNEDGALDKLLFSDNGEAAYTGAELTDDSADGTHAIKVVDGLNTAYITQTGADLVMEMDVRFDTESAGLNSVNNKNNLNTTIRINKGKLAINTKGSSYTRYSDITLGKWYHLTLIRKQGAYAHIIFDEYDANGNRTNIGIYEDVNQRNNVDYDHINFSAGTSYDNLRILTPTPQEVTITTDSKSVFAGNSLKATAKLFWKGLEMKNPGSDMLALRILDGTGENAITDDSITVDGSGTISVSATATAGDYIIKAVALKGGKSATAKFKVSSSDVFEIKELGVSRDNEKRLVQLTVQKNFFYNDEINFITEVYGSDGAVKNTYVKSMYGDSLKIGDNTVALGIDLPDDFDKTTDTIKIYTVTKVSTDEASEADGALTAVKTTGGATITLPTSPAYSEGSDIAVVVLKSTADETDVKADDILFYDQVAGNTAAVNAKWSQNYTGDIIVKTGGILNGAHTVKTAKTASN